MGFTDAANSVPPARVYQLRVDEVLAGMDPEDRERAVAALRDPANPVRWLSRVFDRAGMYVSASAINNWRRRHGVV